MRALTTLALSLAVGCAAAPSPAGNVPTESVPEKGGAPAASSAVEAPPTSTAAPAPPPSAIAPAPTTTAPAGKSPLCGIGPGESVAAPAPWVGESAACRKLDALWAGVSHTERACSTDADCAIVVGSCKSDSVTKKALAKYRTAKCEAPNAKTCSVPPARAACVDGCCRPTG